MPTFTVSPGFAARIANTATDPLLTAYTVASPYNSGATFLKTGAIYFLDGGSNVLAHFGFHTTSDLIAPYVQQSGGSSISGSGSYSANIGSWAGAIRPGMTLDLWQTAGSRTGLTVTVTSYNPTSSSMGYSYSSGTNLGSAQWAFSPLTGQATRSVSSTDGYVTFSNFPEVTPIANGTIEYVLIRDQAGLYAITLTAGSPSSGSEVEIADRTLTTAQPWLLTGSIRLRLPMSYTYSL